MAKKFVRRAAKFFFVGLNILAVVLFLLACLTPYLNTENWWWIGYIGLVVPYLILLLVLLIIFWIAVKPKLAWVSFIVLLIGWKQISVLFSFHFSPEFVKKKEADVLRIVDWNVQSFNGLTKNKEAKKIIRNEIAESIAKMDPDIICLQEFNTATNNGEQSDNLSLFTKNYPYYFFSKDYQRNNGQYQSGCIIFSKYPIIKSDRIKYPAAESLIYADVVKGNDTIRVYTTHLQSFKRRGKQADIVRTEIDKSPYASIICGDFNDVPNSYTYFHVKGERQDAFLKQRFGIGRTYIWMAPTLRIDYMLPDNKFEVKQFDLVDEDLSDHLMLVGDFKLKK
jgi:endonuclease/exonuclease/phosphatase family metal-dependent hydrolase